MEQQKIFGLSYLQAIGALAAVIGIVASFLTWVSVSESVTYVGTTYFSYSHSYSGMESVINPGSYINGSGVIVIVLSLLALAVIFLDRIQKMVPGDNQLNGIIASVKTKSNIILLVFGALIVLIAGLDIAQLNSTNTQVSSALSSQYASLVTLYGYSISASVTAGIGLYLALIAGLALLVSGFFGLMQAQKHPFVQPQQYVGAAPQTYQQPGQQYGPAAPQNQTYQQPAPAQQYQQPVQQQYAPAADPTASNPAPQLAQATLFCGNCGARTTGTDYCMKCGSKVK